MLARRRRFWSKRQRLPGGAKSRPDFLASHGDRLCAGPFFCFAPPQREDLTEVQPRTRHGGSRRDTGASAVPTRLGGRRHKIPSQPGPNAELRLVPNSWNGTSETRRVFDVPRLAWGGVSRGIFRRGGY